ncbi:MAG: Lrp/AsnC family transcriptional regulator [Pseudomonadota bacterium]
MSAEPLDRIDAAILRLLQGDARLTAQEISERVHLSASQVARRRQRLEQAGVIRGYRAELDAGRVGIGVEAFIQVVMATHERGQVGDFVARIRAAEEVVASWTLTGASDYLLQVMCVDLAALNRLVQEVILPHKAVSRVQSQIVMERLKTGAPVPLR